MRYLILLLLLPLYILVGLVVITETMKQPTIGMLIVVLMSFTFMAITLRLWWLYYCFSSSWQLEHKRRSCFVLLVQWLGVALLLFGLHILLTGSAHYVELYRPRHAWFVMLHNALLKVVGPYPQAVLFISLGGWLVWLGWKVRR